MGVIRKKKKIQLVQECVKGKGGKKKKTLSFPLSSHAPLLKRQDAILFQNLKEVYSLQTCPARQCMHIGIGLNLHLIPGLSEALLSECEPSSAGAVVLAGTMWEVRPEFILLVSPARGTLGQLGHVQLLMASDSVEYLALDSVGSSQTAPVPWVSQHEGNRHAVCTPAATHWAWCKAEADPGVVSTIPHLPLRPSCWEPLQACHKIWPKASSGPSKTFPLILVDFESNLWSPMSLCWHYILFSLVTRR